MLRSLVGSEMCIRDSHICFLVLHCWSSYYHILTTPTVLRRLAGQVVYSCLLDLKSFDASLFGRLGKREIHGGSTLGGFFLQSLHMSFALRASCFKSNFCGPSDSLNKLQWRATSPRCCVLYPLEQQLLHTRRLVPLLCLLKLFSICSLKHHS